MALPLLLAGAALAAIKAGKGAHAGNKANEFQDAADEADRQRENAAANLYEAPQLHGAEQRKTFGNLFGQGFLSNFGRDPSTGTVRNAQFGAMLDDPWKYRSIDSMMAKHPSTIKGPKRPKTSVLGSAALGAGEGALSSYMASYSPSGDRAQKAAAGTASDPSAGFGAPTLNQPFKFVMPGQEGDNPFLNFPQQ